MMQETTTMQDTSMEIDLKQKPQVLFSVEI